MAVLSALVVSMVLGQVLATLVSVARVQEWASHTAQQLLCNKLSTEHKHSTMF